MYTASIPWAIFDSTDDDLSDMSLDCDYVVIVDTNSDIHDSSDVPEPVILFHRIWEFVEIIL